MPRIRTVVFDFDDTLVETGDLFREALDSLFDRVEERLDGKGGAAPRAPARSEMLRRQEEIDVRLLGRSGVKPERFSTSLVETYRILVSECGGSARPEDEAFLSEEGLRAFREIPALSPDTARVLRALADRERILYTWGLDEIQRPRIAAHSLQDHFDEIHCVSVKSPESLGRILGDRRPEETIVCGDSLKGEIAPAVALGCHAAHIERKDGWSFLNVPVEGHYHRLARLGDLLGVIEGIESA